jgi:endonuclease/exonuclease/phosphatase (EEP) superfamily protein YafD
MLANLQYSNSAHEAFIRLVGDQQPDIIVVEELTPAWAQALTPLSEHFPSRKLVPREGPFGIGILSRLPMHKVELLDFGHPGYPALLARIATGSGSVSLLAAHPPPPTSDTLFAARNDQLQQAATLLRGLGARTVLLGDLNTSPWSPFFSTLLQRSGLVSARSGFGLLPTWPTFFPPAMIPIDHCLFSSEARVNGVKTGPNIGSDHLPLVIDLLVQHSTCCASLSA